jgi:hypothetical protein
MTVAFHKGLTSELRMRLQLAGLRIEEIDAQRALAGMLTREVDNRGKPVSSNDNKKAIRSSAARWVEDQVEDVLKHHIQLTREWEERNPGGKPFPPMFPEVVLEKCRTVDAENIMETIEELITLAEDELFFG